MSNSEVLLYGNINSYSARQFVTELKALTGKEKTVHINGDGGEVKYGLACLTNLSKADNVTLINDAEANSMLAFMFCYPAKSKKCADYSTFGFHRAGYAEWIEKDPELFDDQAKAEVQKKNDDLRKAMEGTMDSIAFMRETGCSFDELFSMVNGQRKEVSVNAEQALRLGLVDEILSVTPQKRTEIKAMREKIEAKFSTTPIAAENTSIQKPKTTTMTLAEFKAAHAELFTEIVTAERERCETWAVFGDVDIKAVQEGISGGKNISPKLQAEFIRKQISAEQVIKIEGESAEDIKLKAEKKDKEKTPEATKDAEVLAEVRKQLKLA